MSGVVTTHASGKSGSVQLAGGYAFRWMLQGTTHPEIYGWVEKDHEIVKQGGFWRTPDPLAAAQRACDAFDLKLKDG